MKILTKYRVQNLLQLMINHTTEQYTVNHGRGRPGKNSNVTKATRQIYTLSWAIDKEAVKAEQVMDGVYPLLSTDKTLTAKEVLAAHKYQPRLEKRFTQFKSVHNAAPLLFKKVERIEATMFIFFIALVIQSLIEREVRAAMKNLTIEALELYPEGRDAAHPTTSKIFGIFGNVSRYKILDSSNVLEEFIDELTKTQMRILELLGLPEKQYWRHSIPNIGEHAQ